jgi:hypothetical protein
LARYATNGLPFIVHRNGFAIGTEVDDEALDPLLQMLL